MAQSTSAIPAIQVLRLTARSAPITARRSTASINCTCAMRTPPIVCPSPSASRPRARVTGTGGRTTSAALFKEVRRPIQRCGSDLELPLNGGFVVPLGQLPEASPRHERTLGCRAHRRQDAVHGVPPRWRSRVHGQREFPERVRRGLLRSRETDKGIGLRSFAPRWLSWTKRREYRGYGFFPAPAGHPLAAPEGVFNSYRGPTVEPKRGSWKRLLAHLYRNVCQRDAERFRWLIGYLAHLGAEGATRRRTKGSQAG